jgi:hypothetical protein
MTPQYTEGENTNVDLSVWQAALQRVGAFFKSLSNEFLVSLQAVIPDDKDTVTVSYEKTAEVVQIEQHAPSDYAKTITKDAAARDHRATIKAGNSSGRVWAGYDEAAVEAGGDGLAISCEVNMSNSGADQPLLDQINSKYYHLFTKGGTAPATAVGFIEGEKAAHFGWGARQNAFAVPADLIFFLLRRDSNDIEWAVRADGTMLYKGRQVIVKQVKLADGTQADVLVLQ